MSNSKLVSYTRFSPNHSGKRTHSIDRITPHCVVGQLTAAGIAGCFTSPSRGASCNYGIGKDGAISLIVDEGNRSWCTSSNANDQRAVTIECASNTSHPYAMNTAVYNSLVKLCVDICRRNGKKKLIWFGNKSTALNYSPRSDEMVLTVHRWFANKACPGQWLVDRLGSLASEVTRQLDSGFEPYKITIIKTAAVRKSASSTSKKVMTLYPGGAYTIVEHNKAGTWGKLKSGAGWVSLKKTKKL